MQQIKTQQQIEQEMAELGEQFSKFLHTKGIRARFVLAFSDMKRSAEAQREANRAQRKALREAPEHLAFLELLHTKGFRAKCRLVWEGLKKSAAENKQKAATDIARARASAQASIAAHGTDAADTDCHDLSAEELTREFNAFLASKGLADEYAVSVAPKD